VYQEDNTNEWTWQTWVQSVGKKDGEHQIQNQDFAHPDLWAICDGAGGIGFCAADWATYLAKELPGQPFKTKEAVEDWFESIRDPFYEEKRNIVIQSFADISEDYDREGSSSTLLAVWPLERGRLQVLHYGDSAAFLLSQDGKLKERTIRLMDFTQEPFLLHSNEPLIMPQLHMETWAVAPGDVLLLASDTFSQWLLIQLALRDESLRPELVEVLDTPYGLGNQIIYCEQHFNPAVDSVGLLQQLVHECENEARFEAFTSDLFQKGQLAMDDYTLRICLLTPTSSTP